MVLYASPLDAALGTVFDMLDHPQAKGSCSSARNSNRTPPTRRMSTIEPRYSAQYHDGASFIDVELPGVSKESVTVDVKGRTLTIYGERLLRRRTARKTAGHREASHAGTQIDSQEESRPGAEHTDTMERPEKQGEEAAEVGTRVKTAVGKVTHHLQFTLPASADEGNVSADFHDGLLEVRVPRKEAQSHRVSVNVV